MYLNILKVVTYLKNILTKVSGLTEKFIKRYDEKIHNLYSLSSTFNSGSAIGLANGYGLDDRGVAVRVQVG
jgi:hypothetical protein